MILGAFGANQSKQVGDAKRSTATRSTAFPRRWLHNG